MNDTAREPGTRTLLFLLAALLVARTVAAATLPLAFDEAYYWRWSQHLAAGYWDHPPLIAFIIRAGTALFGDTVPGVRFGCFVLSLAATWAVWRSGAILLQRESAGLLAAVLFNLTLMVSVQGLVATPDAPAVATSAFFLFALAKVQQTQRGIWWLAAGVAAGLALLSKYTAPFLGAGALLWLLVSPRERRWLLTPWPYLGGALALLLFLPNLQWNAGHDWITFARQFGRAGGGAFTLRFIGEFLAAQIGLATPFIFVLAVVGLVRLASPRSFRESPAALIAAMVLPAMAYFLWHSLHARVQGNWPSFLYPALSIAAASAWSWSGSGVTGRLVRASRALAIPVACGLTALVYLQALTGIVPLARDPLMRLLAIAYGPVAEGVEAVRRQTGARAILTSGYAQTSWLSFYLPPGTPVIQINERARWLAEPAPDAGLFDGTLLYVAETWRDQSELVAERFSEVTRLGTIPRMRGGRQFEEYAVYRVSGPKGPVLDQK